MLELCREVAEDLGSAKHQLPRTELSRNNIIPAYTTKFHHFISRIFKEATCRMRNYYILETKLFGNFKYIVPLAWQSSSPPLPPQSSNLTNLWSQLPFTGLPTSVCFFSSVTSVIDVRARDCGFETCDRFSASGRAVSSMVCATKRR